MARSTSASTVEGAERQTLLDASRIYGAVSMCIRPMTAFDAASLELCRAATAVFHTLDDPSWTMRLSTTASLVSESVAAARTYSSDLRLLGSEPLIVATL